MTALVKRSDWKVEGSRVVVAATDTAPAISWPRELFNEKGVGPGFTLEGWPADPATRDQQRVQWLSVRTLPDEEANRERLRRLNNLHAACRAEPNVPLRLLIDREMRETETVTESGEEGPATAPPTGEAA